MTPSKILNLKMPPNDANAKTIKDYLVALVEELWEKDDSFSGKRPFGNSGWQSDLYRSLVTAQIVDGDEDGYPLDDDQAHKVIAEAIKAI